MQVYREMDIGTAKASPAQRAEVPHHMLDLVDPADDYSVAEFQREGRHVLEEIVGRGRRAFIVGGSGLHFRALVDPLDFPPTDPTVRARIEAVPAATAQQQLVAADPDAAVHVDLHNPRRVARALEVLELTGHTPSQRAASPQAAAVADYLAEVPFQAVGLDPGEGLGERIRHRMDAMMDAGFLSEVGGLAGRLGRTASQAVGYRQLLDVVRGDMDLARAVAAAVAATSAVASRQRTYLRRDPRIRWLAWNDDPAARLGTAAREVAAWTS